MPIPVKCDFCGKQMRVKDQLGGKKIKCTDCGQHVDVPFPDEIDGMEGDEYQIKEKRPARRDSFDDEETGHRPPRRKSGSNTGLLIGAGVGAALLLLCGCGGLAVWFMQGRQAQPNLAMNPPDQAAKFNPPKFQNQQNQPQQNQNQQPFQPLQPIQPQDQNQNQNQQQPRPRPNNQGFGRPKENQPLGQEKPAPQGLGPARPGEGNLGALNWEGKPDSPAEIPALDLKKPLNGTFGRGVGREGSLFPRSPSVFVAVGGNMSERDEREIWNLSTGKKTGSVKGLSLNDDVCTLSADGKNFAAKAFIKDELWLVDVKTGNRRGPVPTEPRIGFLAFSGSKRLVAANDKGIYSWDIETGDPGQSIELAMETDADTAVAVSHGGKYAAAFMKRGFDTKAEMFDLETGKSVGELPLPPTDRGAPNCVGLTFSPDGKELAALLRHWSDAIVLVWSMESGELVKSFTMEQFDDVVRHAEHSYKAERLQWFPDGQRWLAFGVAVIDREVEKVTFKVPGVGEFAKNYATQVLPNGHLAIVQFPFAKPMTMTSLELSGEKLKQASQVIAEGGTAADANLPKLTKAEWGDAKRLSLEGPAGSWKVSVDGAPAAKAKLMPAALTLHNRTLPLINAAVTSPATGRLMVQYGKKTGPFGIDPFAEPAAPPRDAGKKKPGAAKGNELETPTTPAYVDAYDLTTGKVVSTTPLPYECELMDVSADGKRICVRIADKKDRIDVFEVEGGAHVAGWRPYQDEKGDNERQIEAAKFVDNTHVLTKNHWGDTVALWEIPTCKAIYTIDAAQSPGVSPGQKFIVVSSKTGKGYRFFDALTGDPKGGLALPGTVQAAAFHPDGDLLGAIIAEPGGSFSFMAWKLADGSVTHEFPLGEGGTRMHWCSKLNVLVDNTRLLDLPSKMMVWNYRIAGFGLELAQPPDGRHWYFLQRIDPRNRSIVLNAVNLPDTDAQATMLASDLKPDYVIEPGSNVAVTVNLGVQPPGKNNFATQVAGAFTQSLQKNGCTVAAGAPVTIQVTSAQGKVEQDEVVEIREFGAGGTTRIPVERVNYTVAVLRGNEKLWERTGVASTGGWGLIRKEQNLSWQDQLRKEMWGSFENQLLHFALPKYVIANSQGFGTSMLTADGVVAQKK